MGYHGDAAVAVPILEEAVALARECSDPALLRHALFTLGKAVELQPDLARAMALQEEAEQAARAARAINPDAPNADSFVGLTLYAQGVVARRSGDTATAVARFAAAEPFLRTPEGRRRRGMMLGELGVIQVCTGHLDEATATLVEAVALTWDVRHDAALTRALRGLAAVAAGTEQPIAAARLLGASDTIDASTAHAVVAASRDRDIVAWCAARLSDIFEANALNAQWRAGAKLTLEQAVALAREVAKPALGAARVHEIWQAAGAPDPGPVPTPQLADLHLVSLSAVADADALLTDREREVLTLLCQRLTDPEIAARLFIRPRTANRHVSNILSKLDAANRREAAAIAAGTGLV
jgi:non-specific serine/threonine protein kinase